MSREQQREFRALTRKCPDYARLFERYKRRLPPETIKKVFLEAADKDAKRAGEMLERMV